MQSKQELEEFYSSEDPWNYYNNPEDRKRVSRLIEKISLLNPQRCLDIGCGNGFVSKEISKICPTFGIDISENAINHAKKYEGDNLKFEAISLFEIGKLANSSFDLILITGVLYPQYIGRSHSLVYELIDKLLKPQGHLISVHIDDWYSARFPYLLTEAELYTYREYDHRLEVYVK